VPPPLKSILLSLVIALAISFSVVLSVASSAEAKPKRTSVRSRGLPKKKVLLDREKSFSENFDDAEASKAGSPEVPREAVVVVPSKNTSARGRWTLGLLYNSANQLVYGGNVNLLSGNVRFVITDQTTPQVGFSGGYFYSRPWGFGYSTELMAELPRTSQGISGTAGDLKVTGKYLGDPKLSLVTMNASGNYSLGKIFFLFAGFNYPFVISSESSAQFSGLIGYLGGVGGYINEHLQLAASYRLVAMKGHMSSEGMEFDIAEANFKGVMIQLRYGF
jgi:hypothetical protein